MLRHGKLRQLHRVRIMTDGYILPEDARALASSVNETQREAWTRLGSADKYVAVEREFGTCMRCGAKSSATVDIIGNLTTFWLGTTFGHRNPTLCRKCIEDVHKFTQQRIDRSDGDPMVPTQAQWELAQGEVHDLRVALAGIAEAVRSLNAGTWSVYKFCVWFVDRMTETDTGLVERFKNVTRRLGPPA